MRLKTSTANLLLDTRQGLPAGKLWPVKTLLTPLLSGLLVVFLFSCVFDPADKILSGKVWLFVGAWIVAIVSVITTKEPVKISLGLLIYILLFISIPILSILGYFARGGTAPYEGANYLKGYILISLAMLLVITRVSLVRRLSIILTILAFVIVFVYFVIKLFPDLYLAVYAFGLTTGLVQLDDARQYGDEVVMTQVYFVTSPMLIVPIAYYFNLMSVKIKSKEKILAFALMGLNIAAMILAGSRNNILAAILFPLVLWVGTSRRKRLAYMSAFCVALFIVWVFRREVGAFFDPNEISNSIKISLIEDYWKIFQDVMTLTFGQGLGSFHYFEGRGLISVTELTFLEMVRNFGLFGASIMALLLVLPAARGFTTPSRRELSGLSLGYVFFLIMSASNPLLFSSMGVLILSVLMSEIYRDRRQIS